MSTVASKPKVERLTVEKAVKALFKWKEIQTAAADKVQLLPEDEFLYLVLTLKKIPHVNGPGGARTNPYKVPLPHPLFGADESSECCLIIDDRPKNAGRDAEARVTSEFAKRKISEERIGISKVIKLSKLRTDYKPFEAKRKLCDSYELFFADRRVIPLLPRLLGKQFFKKKKLPLPVDLGHKNWKEQVERACGSALLYFKTGTCSVVRVAKASMEREEVVENVVAAIEGVAGFVPRKWGGVRSLHLKFSESLALPVYQALPDMKLKIEGVKENAEGGGGEKVKEEGKKGEKLGKKKVSKKGRIHEVPQIDDVMVVDELGIDDDGDDEEAGMIENDDLESDELIDKSGDGKGKGKVKKVGKGDGTNDAEKSAKEGGKKKRKGEVLDLKKDKKRVKKVTGEGNGNEKQKKSGSEDLGGKKGKKKLK